MVEADIPGVALPLIVAMETDLYVLALGLLTSVVSLVSFMVILWGLSGPANIPHGTWGVLHVPSYLLCVALFSWAQATG
jgi:ABC-type uncharacterized transport system fused permease/ATPase subunit